ncbi:hypothetical protein RIF29_17360 [Crotalaria pallida]|uniref:Uncharacterized protein n=1 Tax=Crotalaria pallida TaxID=3830 RepID=A0AAN9FNW0_CROPI
MLLINQGLMILTMTAGIPQLHPRTCPPNHNQECDGPTSTQFAILILGLVLMAIGTGGIRPCSIPFAIDQFDATSANGRQGIRTFFNWFLNKAAIIQGDLNEQGFSTNLWRLCSIQQVEEVKCFLSLLPIWVSGILGMLPVVYSGTFFVTQAIMMDKHIGGLEFEIPAASIAVVSLITAVLWLQVYNFYAQRVIAKITKQEDGLTCLQKVIIGAIFGVLTMLCAALVEGRRRGYHYRPIANPEIRTVP